MANTPIPSFGPFPSMRKRSQTNYTATTKSTQRSTQTSSGPGFGPTQSIAHPEFPAVPAWAGKCFEKAVNKAASTDFCKKSKNSLHCYCSNNDFISSITKCFNDSPSSKDSEAQNTYCLVLYYCAYKGGGVAKVDGIEKACNPGPRKTTPFLRLPNCAVGCVRSMLRAHASKGNCTLPSTPGTSTDINECMCRDVEKIVADVGSCLEDLKDNACWGTDMIDLTKEAIQDACRTGYIEHELLKLPDSISEESDSFANSTDGISALASVTVTTTMRPWPIQTKTARENFVELEIDGLPERPFPKVPKWAAECVQKAINKGQAERDKLHRGNPAGAWQTRYLCTNREFIDSIVNCFNSKEDPSQQDIPGLDERKEQLCKIFNYCYYNHAVIADLNKDSEQVKNCKLNPFEIIRFMTLPACATTCLPNILSGHSATHRCESKENLARQSVWECICKNLDPSKLQTGEYCFYYAPECWSESPGNINRAISQACQAGHLESEYAKIPAWGLWPGTTTTLRPQLSKYTQRRPS